jgi:hypothetical protein
VDWGKSPQSTIFYPLGGLGGLRILGGLSRLRVKEKEIFHLLASPPLKSKNAYQNKRKEIDNQLALTLLVAYKYRRKKFLKIFSTERW